MNYKEANKAVYDATAKEFEKQTGGCFHLHAKCAELFVASLPNTKILDLGSGPGRDSIYFKEKRLYPLCFDISPEMLKLCEQKGLETMLGDLENLPFEDETFNGVWAHTSLLHMPKANLPAVLTKISQILTPNGVFYCCMKEGDFEGWVESDKYQGSKRFFSLYNDVELRKLVMRQFKIVSAPKDKLGNAVFLNYLCVKLPPQQKRIWSKSYVS